MKKIAIALAALATLTGLRAKQPETNWLSHADVRNLMVLADWEPVASDYRILFPFRAPVLDWFFNRCLAPLLPPEESQPLWHEYETRVATLARLAARAERP